MVRFCGFELEHIFLKDVKVDYGNCALIGGKGKCTGAVGFLLEGLNTR